MTREEAIKILWQYDMNFEPHPAEDVMHAIDVAIDALGQEPIIYCKDCKHWHEWDDGTGSCQRSNIMWVGSDYDDYCSFGERMESDTE